jgi:hypothetical protein
MLGYGDCGLSMGNQLYSLCGLLHGFSVGLVIHGRISLSLKTCNRSEGEVESKQHLVTNEITFLFELLFFILH